MNREAMMALRRAHEKAMKVTKETIGANYVCKVQRKKREDGKTYWVVVSFDWYKEVWQESTLERTERGARVGALAQMYYNIEHLTTRRRIEMEDF